LLAYKAAGRIDEAERAFQRMLDVSDGRGSYPMRYFYDTDDVRRVGGFPLPGLRVMNWPEPADVLPPGVAAQLLEQ
jgi:hypothetical protein